MVLFRLFALICQGGCPWGVGVLLLSLALQAFPASGQMPPAFRFERPRMRHLRLPFILQRNLIVVSARLNGQGPYNFLLDTGVGTSILTDPAVLEFLQLRTGEEIQLAGAGESETPLIAYRTDSVRVQLPGVVAPALTFYALSEDILNLSGFVGMPIHGILGYDVFQSFVVEVHAEPAYLDLYAPTSYRPPRSRRWARMPLLLQANRAYLTTTVQTTDSLALPLKLLLDTGAGHALSLEVGATTAVRLPAHRLRAQLGRGLSGNINGYLGRVAGVKLGRYHVRNMLTSFPDEREVSQRVSIPRSGTLGFELLKRFTIIIDYAHQQLLLRPNSLYHDPFEHDMSGLELLAAGTDYRRYFIQNVAAGSPAEAAGLQPRDELLAINLSPVSSLTLSQVSRLLHSADERVLLVIVRRADGELLTARLRLKRQI